ncbi:MAG: O-antigen ligase family protein [Fusobacteriaceae bacterium]
MIKIKQKLNEIIKEVSEFEKEELVLRIIIFLLPFSLLTSQKLFKNILFPLLIILSLIKIKKNGFRYCFYEKCSALFIISVLISIVFSEQTREQPLEKLIGHLSWLLLPTLIGQFKLKKRDFNFLVVSILIGIIPFYRDYLIRIQKNIFDYTQNKVSIIEIFKKENLEVILKMSEQMWRLGYGGMYKFIAVNAAVLLIISIVLITYSFKNKNSKILTNLCKIAIVPTLFFLVLTQSRSAYLCFIIFTLYSFIPKIKSKYFYYIVPIIGFLFAMRKHIHNNPFIKRSLAIVQVDTANTGRLEVYKEAFNIFKQNIFIGSGFETFFNVQNRINYRVSEFYYHPHNMSLKLLSEMGLIGFISYFFMMFNILNELRKKERTIDNQIALSLLGFLLIFENFELLIINRYVYIFIFLFISFSLNSFYNKNKKRN